MMGSMAKVVCANKACGKEFEARTADVKRGWGKFCSKSCKAAQQTRDTGIAGPDYRADGRSVRQMKQGHFAKSKLGRLKPWQRGDKCLTQEDYEDLLRNPRIIEPLYSPAPGGEFERDGELFFANFSNEEGEDV